MTRIHQLELRWETMTPDEKVQEVATKTRLLRAAEDGDIETIGAIDVEAYFGPPALFIEIINQIVETSERQHFLTGSPTASTEMLADAKKNHDVSVELFKAMFLPHYTLLARQKAELDEVGKDEHDREH